MATSVLSGSRRGSRTLRYPGYEPGETPFLHACIAGGLSGITALAFVDPVPPGTPYRWEPQVRNVIAVDASAGNLPTPYTSEERSADLCRLGTCQVTLVMGAEPSRIRAPYGSQAD